jgi:signal transduction histidine kinase
LVQALVELHDAHMRIDSVVGQGTTVTVKFPMAAEPVVEKVVERVEIS